MRQDENPDLTDSSSVILLITVLSYVCDCLGSAMWKDTFWSENLFLITCSCALITFGTRCDYRDSQMHLLSQICDVSSREHHCAGVASHV